MMDLDHQYSTQPPTNVGSGIRGIRVLLIAYACEPGRGSEPGTGWNIALGLAARYHVTVVTRGNNRSVIEGFLADYTGHTPKFLFIDPPFWMVRLKKLGVIPVQLFYWFWQRAVARKLKQDDEQFDIVHQLTFNTFEIPPTAFRDSKALKVWGPVGGGQIPPRSFLPAFGFYGALKERFRIFRVGISARSSSVERALFDSSMVFFANSETRDLLSDRCQNRFEMMVDVGVDIRKFSPPPHRGGRDKVTILFAGGLEGRKGAILLIEAFERLVRNHGNLELRIVGDGRMRRRLEKTVRKMNLADRVIFMGSIGHDFMRKEFELADIFAFPSLRDTSGAVVIEAMAMELPVVCFDHHGAAVMVDDSSGIKVPAKGWMETVIALQDGLEQLIKNHDLRHQMGKSARAIVVLRYDWQAKLERISSCYDDLYSGSRDLSFSYTMNPGGE